MEIVAGDGMILLNMQELGERLDSAWALHAVAELLTATEANDPLMVCSETFADDSLELSMTNKWHLAHFKDALGFQSDYANSMPPDKYSLWALRAVGR